MAQPAQASECEERQGLSVGEVVDSRGNIKLLNDEDNLELNQQEQVQNSTVEFIQQEQVQNSTVELIQQEQARNSTVEQIIAVPVPRLRPRSFTT